MFVETCYQLISLNPFETCKALKGQCGILLLLSCNSSLYIKTFYYSDFYVRTVGDPGLEEILCETLLKEKLIQFLSHMPILQPQE